MIKKILRIALLTAAVLVVPAALALLGLRLAFPDSRLKALLENQLRGWTMHEAKIGGLSLSLLKGLELKDLSLSKGNDFRSGTLFTAKRVVFAPRFRPSFSGEANISELSFERPELFIKKSEFSAAGIFGSAGRLKKSKKPRKYPPFIFSVARLSVSSGTIHFTDGGGLELSGVNISASGFTPESPADIALSFSLASKSGRLDADSSLKLDVPGEKLEITSARARAGGASMDITGSVEGFKSPKYKFALSGDAAVLERTGGVFLGDLPFGLFGGKISLKVFGDARNFSVQAGK